MVDIYGNNNTVRQITTKLVKPIILQKHRYPMMIRRHSDQQVNLMSIQRKETHKTLLDDITAKGQGYPETIEGFRYLIRNYLCYIEVPLTRYNKQGTKVKSYQKKVVTANPNIVALWLNEDIEDVNKKYKLKFDNYINTDPEHKPIAPYLELKVNKDGEHKITKPRKDIDLSNKDLTVTPLYLINESINVLREQMKSSCTHFIYTKDNGTIREITTTCDMGFLEKTYGDETSWVLDAKAKQYNSTDIMDCDTVFRGYIRLPEVGGSRYDSATRSLNFARINTIKPEYEPDLSLIDIDLSTVVTAFITALQNDPSKGSSIRMAFKGYDIDNAQSLTVWAEKAEKTYSTAFKRDLAKFMLEHKNIFSDFTGKPVKTAQIQAGLGIQVDNIDMSDYFDFD